MAGQNNELDQLIRISRLLVEESKKLMERQKTVLTEIQRKMAEIEKLKSKASSATQRKNR